MNQKGIIIFIVIILLLAGGVFWFINRDVKQVFKAKFNNESVNNQSTAVEKPAAKESVNPASVTSTKSDPERIAELKPKVEEAVKVKDVKVREESKNRPLTDDELRFLDNPKSNVLGEMEKKGEITSHDKEIMLKNK